VRESGEQKREGEERGERRREPFTPWHVQERDRENKTDRERDRLRQTETERGEGEVVLDV
jgi:hypothetical protein